MIVLDTDVIVDFLRGDDDAVEAVEAWVSQGERLATTLVNAAELFRGVHGAPDPARAMEELNGLLRTIVLIPFDRPAAHRFGEIMAALDQAGRPIPTADGLVAAMALGAGAKVATRNVRHFGRVAGLEVLVPEG